MRYITKLREENTALKNQLLGLNRQLTDALAYLASPKFTGIEGGERKDWVDTTEMKTLLMSIRQNTLPQ